MPITAFIGVRISWLIVARNELFGLVRGFGLRARLLRLGEERALRSATPTLAAIVDSSR